MGIIKQAVPGGFSGKVGTVIGSSWKGIVVMRGLTIANQDKHHNHKKPLFFGKWNLEPYRWKRYRERLPGRRRNLRPSMDSFFNHKLSNFTQNIE